MTQKKDAVDSLFDFVDGIVDGAAKAFKGVPGPGESEDGDSGDTPVETPPKRVIDIQQPLLKSDETPREGPREVTLRIKAFSKLQKGGVAILAETETHTIIRINLNKEDWKTVCDNADWLRMVKE